MAIIINFAGASLRKPGAYSRVKIAQGGAAQAQLGVVALIGEADEGDDFTAETGISAVTFSPEQFEAVRNKFVTGTLVDNARIVLAPSNDPDILGGAQQIVVLKTNASVKATDTIASYGVVNAKRAGAPGNNISYEIVDVAGQRVITIKDIINDIEEISDAIGGQIVMDLTVADGSATAATLTITDTTLATTVTGAATAPDLSIDLTQFNTVGQVADFINTQTGYTANVTAGQELQPPTVFDNVTAVDIFDPAVYDILRDAQDIINFFEESVLVDFVPDAAIVGVPVVTAQTFLSGGALGATSNAAIQAALDECAKARINFIVPLFSRDATSDITDGLTDPTSAYTIDAIHANLRSHVAQQSTVKGRKERQGYASFKGSFADTKEKSAALGSARVALNFQDIDVTNSLGELVTAQPHSLATINAGMKAAAVVGLSNLNKLIQASGHTHVDFDPEVDFDEAIDANLSYVENGPGGGIRFAIDNSTYGQTTNAWIFNRPSVLYASDTAAFTIRFNTEQFVGRRNSDVTPTNVESLLISVMDSLRGSGIIVPDANTNGKGFKDLTVDFTGSIINTSVTLALVENFEFVLNDIQVQRATS
jgi:hypothetical protein